MIYKVNNTSVCLDKFTSLLSFFFSVLLNFFICEYVGYNQPSTGKRFEQRLADVIYFKVKTIILVLTCQPRDLFKRTPNVWLAASVCSSFFCYIKSNTDTFFFETPGKYNLFDIELFDIHAFKMPLQRIFRPFFFWLR